MAKRQTVASHEPNSLFVDHATAIFTGIYLIRLLRMFEC